MYAHFTLFSKMTGFFSKMMLELKYNEKGIDDKYGG